jgi:eukaryotic-like serine/threonine-protein kinase
MGNEAVRIMKPVPSEQAVFAEALQLPSPEARAAYLEATCGMDGALRCRVEALLRAAGEAGDFLEQPHTELRGDDLPTSPAEEPTERPGDRIGRYKLLEKIGEGGCGVVYLAEQEEPVRRRVALKIIKLGMDTRSVVARFEAERQALAMMDHPNIAIVFDGGSTPTGRPYFVMELVRGSRITDYCDTARLSNAERLELFLQVCQAVQHAHQKGIIHRDLKPSNILVTVNDGVAVPKVIDFGIAKATGQKLTDKTVITQFHAFLGTPAYTSPEQAEMSSVDIDTRSDIYSLGVLLYELLTGRPPFDGEQLLSVGFDEMRRIIRQVEPPRPSARLSTLGEPELTTLGSRRRTHVPDLAGAMRGDLDWIVMKCLEKDRARRYETANGLAADIRRHLDDEPVSARPPSAGYRCRKWMHRNKLLFASGASVFAALLIGFAVSLGQYAAKSRAYEKLVLAEQEQNRLREAAQLQSREAETAAARSGQIAGFLKEMLRNVAPGVARGRDTALLRDILDQTAKRVATDLKGQAEVQADLYSTLGRTYAELSLGGEARAMFQQSVSLYRTALKADDPRLSQTLGQLAVVQATLGNTVAAQPNADEALRLARKLNDPETLVDALRCKARSLDPDQDVPEAVPFWREALEVQRKSGSNPLVEGDILRQLGGALAWGTNMPAAETALREALTLHEKILATNDLTLARDWFNLAQVAGHQRKYFDAEQDIRHTLDIARPVLDRKHQNRVDYIAFLAHYLILQGKGGEAVDLLKEELRLAPDDPRYHHILGTVFARRGFWADAADEMQRATGYSSDPNFVPLDAVVALLKAGRTNECLDLWHEAMIRSADTKQFDVADKLAKTGLLLALSPPDMTRAGALADYASTATGPAWLVPWVEFVKAFADLRRERFDSAAEWSARCRNDVNATAPCRAAACAVQAMTFSALKQEDQAKRSLEEGSRLLAGAPGPASKKRTEKRGRLVGC